MASSTPTFRRRRSCGTPAPRPTVRADPRPRVRAGSASRARGRDRGDAPSSDPATRRVATRRPGRPRPGASRAPDGMSVERPMTGSARSYTLATMSLVRPVQCPLLVGRDDLLQLAERRIAEAAAGRGHAPAPGGRGGRRQDAPAACDRAPGRCRRASAIAQGDLSPAGPRGARSASIRDLARDDDAGRVVRRPGRGPPRDRSAARARDALAHRQLLVHEIADRILERSTGRRCSRSTTSSGPTSSASRSSASSPGVAADRPLLLVAGYRPDELPAGSIHREWRARLLSQRHAEEVRLERADLRRDGAGHDAHPRHRACPPRARSSRPCYERTNGIPLHIEELLGRARRRRPRSTDARSARRTSPTRSRTPCSPGYGRLSPDAQAVARAGAVIGRCFVPGRGRGPPRPAGRRPRRRRSRSSSSSRSCTRSTTSTVATTTSATSCCATPCTARSRRASSGGSMPGRASSARILDGRVRGPRVAPLRARRASATGLPGGPGGCGGGRPPVEPARVVRALPASGPQRAVGYPARRAGAALRRLRATRPASVDDTDVEVPAAYEARRQFLAAGDPLHATEMLLARRERRREAGGIDR